MLSEEETQDLVSKAICMCRRDIDTELIKLHEQDRLNAWTEERAQEIATYAADLAVKKITDSFYMSVGRKTVATIGVMTVVGLVAFRDFLKRLVGLE